MISYLVVLIVPLLISQMFYYQSTRLAEQNAAEVCDIALEQTLRTLDQAFNRCAGSGSGAADRRGSSLAAIYGDTQQREPA